VTYSHYSLLQTIQRNFGLPCLQNTCDTAKVKPMTPLFAVKGSAAAAFTPLAVPGIATPTPVPAEPVSYVTDTSNSGGWAVQPAPALGTGDNTYGAVAAVSPSDVWAVGNYLPDAPTSNQDATLATAAHFDGTRWTQTPVPHSGPNFNTLFGVAATRAKAWAVGVALNSSYQAHSLIEAWDGSAWHIAATPNLDTQRDTLYSAVALSAGDVWAVGHQQSENGTYGTLIEPGSRRIGQSSVRRGRRRARRYLGRRTAQRQAFRYAAGGALGRSCLGGRRRAVSRPDRRAAAGRHGPRRSGLGRGTERRRNAPGPAAG
jgi:hypothetical protein